MTGTRAALILFILLGMASIAASARLGVPPPAAIPAEEWPAYGRDTWNTKYSPLAQIDRTNVARLRVAWRWNSPDNALAKKDSEDSPGPNEATPIMVGGVLYTPTGLNQVAAIDAATGKPRWVFNPHAHGYVHRGVALWEGTGRNGERERRILMATKDAYLIALDAATGRPIRSFGRDGRVDLTKGLRRPVDRKSVSNTSPPVVCGDVIVCGGSVDDFSDQREMPPGDVRGFDARTGRQLWTFHSIPQEGEFGNESWERGSWKYTGSVNVWAVMSYDPELDYVYLPFGTANDDWYGGHRPGAGLFSESLVCLEAKTGRRVWHFQMVHHGLWDYDLPCAPNLVDVTQNGRRIKAVAQVTKQAFCYVFDRVTGKPLWPIEERPVPPTTMPGDRAWPTQPFPTRPAAFDRQGLSEDDLIDFTPELRAEAKEIVKTWVHGPLYTPPATTRTILMPGWVGGASWAGAAADPETGILYVPSITNPMWLALQKPPGKTATVNYKIGDNGEKVEGPQGLPLTKPPYGRVTAIDLNSGDHLWMKPIGDGPRDHPALRHLNLPPLGLYRRSYTLVTKTLLLVFQEGSWFGSELPKHPAKLRAFDKRTGDLVAEVEMPQYTHATGAPITYMAGGKQYVVVPTGGAVLPAELVALALP
jgi:glucose dehydrogenase